MICPVCNGESFSTWGNAEEYAIVACTACGLGITSPFPSGKDILASNQATYQVEQRVQTYLSRRRYFEKRYRKYLSNIKLFKQAERLLDVGCNIGLFLNVAREEGFSVTGVEVNRACAEYARNAFHLEIFSDYLEQIPFDDHGFDVITLFDVLEHVPDIHAFLASIERVLKPGGLLVVQSPNIRSLMATLTRGKWSWLSPPDHLYHFSPDSLTMLLRSHGFNVKKLRTWEPAKDFSDNLITANISNPMLRRFLLMGNALTRLFTLPVIMTQGLWWRQQRGALLELYAVKRQEDNLS